MNGERSAGGLIRIIDDQICLNTTAMQEAFRLTREGLAKWARQGCPKAQRGWWPLAEVIAWRGLASRSASVDDGGDSDISDAALKLKYEAELKRLQTEGLDLKNAVQRGDYVLRDNVVSTLAEHSTILKRSLQGLSRKVATEISPFVDPTCARRIESQLSEIVADALTVMSNGQIYTPRKKRVVKG